MLNTALLPVTAEVCPQQGDRIGHFRTAFAAALEVRRTLLVGGNGIAVEDFPNRSVAD